MSFSGFEFSIVEDDFLDQRTLRSRKPFGQLPCERSSEIGLAR